MFGNIVVGCDNTQATNEAVALAEQLRAPNGHLVLVSAFAIERSLAGPIAPLAYADWLRERATKSLERAQHRLDSRVAFETQTVASGSAAQALTDVAETVHADLIVVGPTHRSRFARVTGRSTVQRLLHGAPCAVAVARGGQDRRFANATARIAVAYDGSPEAEHALAVAHELAAARSATLVLCAALEHVAFATPYSGPVTDRSLDRQREAAARAQLDAAAERAPDGVTIETRFGWGPAAATVLSLAGSDVDLLVAGSRGYGPLHRALAGSTSAGLLVHGDVPLLLTPRVRDARAEADDALESRELV